LSPGARADELRVMIVTDQYEPMIGGVPTVTRELARGLAERGHAVAVVAPSTSRHGRISPTGQAGQADPMTVAFRGSVRWPWYEGQRLGFLSASDARGLISVFAPDVAHIHSPLTLGLAARSAARRRGVPVLYTNHYLPANVHPSAPARPRSRAAALSGAIADAAFETAFYGYLTGFANRCDQVTAPTMTALRLLRDHGLRAPSQAVSNGVDLAAFSPEPPESQESPESAESQELRRRYQLPAGAPIIVSVGRLSPEKHANVLIEAAARLGTDQAKAAQASPVLALVGTGPDEGRLHALAERLGVSGRVRFLGFVPGSDLPGLYRLADVFAIASQAELQSLVTMEAMATGLPVVAVDAGALGELVHAGENGFLVRPGQAAEEAAAMADCLGLLCRDHALRGRMSKASLRIIGNHDRHRVLDRWESIYRALAGRGTAEEKNRQR
jgi:glycosyltransferase involved in cell wall biosynthesis